MSRAHTQLQEFITALIGEAAARGEARDDIPAAELADYCLHALTAASGLSSEAALGRLINVTLTGVRARPGNGSIQPGQLSPAGRAARPGRS